MSVEPGECDIVARYLKRHDFPKGKYKLRGVGRVHPTHSGRNVTHRPHPMLQSSRIASAFGGLVLLGHIVSFFSLRPSPVQPDWMSSMIMPNTLVSLASSRRGDCWTTDSLRPLSKNTSSSSTPIGISDYLYFYFYFCSLSSLFCWLYCFKTKDYFVHRLLSRFGWFFIADIMTV